MDVTLQKDNFLVSFPVTYREVVGEVSLAQSFWNRLHLRWDVNLSDSRERKGEARWKALERLTLSYRYARKEVDYRQHFSLDGAAAGQNRGDGDYRRQSGGLAYQRNAKTTYYVDVQGIDLRTDGAGNLQADAILNFWGNLIAGDRYYTYHLDAHSVQYHLGIQAQRSDTWTWRGGLQYMDIRPTAVLDDWTPSPFFLIGRINEEIVELPYTKLTLGFISGGLTYKKGPMEIHYGLGQYIPISEKRTSNGSGSVEGKGGFHFSIRDIQAFFDKIKENPGGNLQTVEVRWSF